MRAKAVVVVEAAREIERKKGRERKLELPVDPTTVPVHWCNQIYLLLINRLKSTR